MRLLVYISALCFFLCPVFLLAQDEDADTVRAIFRSPDDPPSEIPSKIHPFSIRLSGGVPNPLASELFRKRMIGIYEVNVSGNFRIGEYFSVGVGINNSLFSISNRTKFAAHTKLQLYGGFVRLGYDKYHHGKMFSSIYLTGGYSQGVYTGVVNMDTKPHNLNVYMGFMQPTYSINFFAEERMTLGFYGGVRYNFWQFDPEQINLADAGVDISKFKNNSNAMYWIIGLEMYIGLGKL